MIEIQNISWRNFMSYGDETTSLDLANLGQVLITGEISDNSTDNLKRSNGSGKSTIPNVILWALFGRTMHSANPGDSIINYQTNGECWAKITFKNGDSIIRTRGTKSHNELIYTKNGEEHTLSTSKNLQQLLIKDLKLDWELFTNSAFFTQYGKSWLEMADNSRKKALERILRVDRFTYYAASAKKNAETAELTIQKHNTQIENHEKVIATHKRTIEKNDTLKINFEATKKIRIQDINNKINDDQNKINNIDIPDIQKIDSQWQLYHKIEARIESIKDERNDSNRKLRSLSATIEELKTKITSWNKKKGTQCLTCGQNIDDNHIQQHIEPYNQEMLNHKLEYDNIATKLTTLNETVNDALSKLALRKPKITVREAKGALAEIDSINKRIMHNQNWIKEIEREANPYTNSTDEINTAIGEQQEKITHLNAKKEEQELLYKHYNFIYKAYSERSKIKSYVFMEHIPFINQRINHYLDMLNLDVRIKLTDNLGVDSNMWGYEYQSGGERKRTDVAFMLAAFDFHEMMYGRQSNILVLDEVDGRMDDDGIDGLIDIIKQELANKVETILIISHRNQMHDVFDKEIHVIKTNNCSRIKIN